MGRSKLLQISIKNLGCIGSEGLTIDLDNILCLVGGNNTGKSTVLRAYELAVGKESYEYESDHCKRSGDNNSTIEISVHIPENTLNIAEEWKIKSAEYLIVKSKWEWDKDGNKTRQTWDPDGNQYSEEGKASGIDQVFNSRLPQPVRIGALQEPKDDLEELKKIILQSIADELENNLKDTDQDIYKALENFKELANIPVLAKQDEINTITTSLASSHQRIFPGLDVEFNVGIDEINFKPLSALISGSSLKIKEWGETVDWSQQGTGSKRALFWALLQIKSKIKSKYDINTKIKRDIKALEKEKSSLEKKKATLTQPAAIEKNSSRLQEVIKDLEKLYKNDPETLPESDGLKLPGYMLLIDEPEIGLHPNAVRAASEYLYELSNDPSWQVILSTHSPLFLNPLQDHTTITRLLRDYENPSPKTYRSDDVEFCGDEIENLKLLNRFDQSVAEMFFGQYPIIVEGDSEFAVFEKIMQLNPEKYALYNRPIIVRAHGKYTMTTLIKMLTHFKVGFSILHDSDYPKNKRGNTNNAWTANSVIYNEIKKARSIGLQVIHRVSISTFESQHLDINVDDDGNVINITNKDKPWVILNEIKKNEAVRESITKIFDELTSTMSLEDPFDKDFENGLLEYFKEWVLLNKITDFRYQL